MPKKGWNLKLKENRQPKGGELCRMQCKNLVTRSTQAEQFSSNKKHSEINGRTGLVQESEQERQDGSRCQNTIPKNTHHFLEHIYGTLCIPEGYEVYNMSLQQQVQIVNYVRATGKANVIQAHIPMKTGWNIRLLNSLAESDSDREVVQYLLFGWPINHDGRPVTVNMINHASANCYQQHVTDYIAKELSLGCLC